MSKQVEVPEGIERLDPDFDYEEMEPCPVGDYIRVSDLGALYKHFSDRLLFELKYEIGPYTIAQIEAALRAASIPTTSDEEGSFS